MRREMKYCRYVRRFAFLPRIISISGVKYKIWFEWYYVYQVRDRYNYWYDYMYVDKSTWKYWNSEESNYE